MSPRRRKSDRKELGPGPGSVPSHEDSSQRLLGDLRALIDAARLRVAQAANAGLVLLHWHVGKRILEDILGHERAEYGKRIVETLSQALSAEYGRGFGAKSLFHMIRFVEAFSDERIV